MFWISSDFKKPCWIETIKIRWHFASFLDRETTHVLAVLIHTRQGPAIYYDQHHGRQCQGSMHTRKVIVLVFICNIPASARKFWNKFNQMLVKWLVTHCVNKWLKYRWGIKLILEGNLPMIDAELWCFLCFIYIKHVEVLRPATWLLMILIAWEINPTGIGIRT